jgi:tuberculosinol/isotuberculosinol synthase
MDLETFQSLPTKAVAQLVRESGSKVCVFPINGTRRWYLLEHGFPKEDFVGAYLAAIDERHIELYKLLFDHGIDTLVTPVVGPDILTRERDTDLVERGLMTWFGGNPGFLGFYDEYDVRVRVYGEAQRYLQDTSIAHVLHAFDETMRHTATHQSHRLFYGVCAHDATETIAQIGVRFYQQHNRLPDKREIVTAYYGEYVEPVSFFIGFGPFTAFDMPLLSTGAEDLYFTVSPSLYLDIPALRAILYDHLYVRPGQVDCTDLAAEEWETMKKFYQTNLGRVLGIGAKRGGIWYPQPQVVVPDNPECWK